MLPVSVHSIIHWPADRIYWITQLVPRNRSLMWQLCNHQCSTCLAPALFPKTFSIRFTFFTFFLCMSLLCETWLRNCFLILLLITLHYFLCEVPSSGPWYCWTTDKLWYPQAYILWPHCRRNPHPLHSNQDSTSVTPTRYCSYVCAASCVFSWIISLLSSFLLSHLSSMSLTLFGFCPPLPPSLPPS